MSNNLSQQYFHIALINTKRFTWNSIKFPCHILNYLNLGVYKVFSINPSVYPKKDVVQWKNNEVAINLIGGFCLFLPNTKKYVLILNT